jgi:hypothetical protein
LQFGLVIAKEGVGNLLVGEQVQVHVAGHDGGQPAVFFLLGAGGNLAELPTVIERQYRILRRFRMRARSSTSLPESCSKQGNTNDTTGYYFPH